MDQQTMATYSAKSKAIARLIVEEDSGKKVNPFEYLPVPWRVPVGAFCIQKATLIKNRSAFISELLGWMYKDGLTLDEFIGITDRLQSARRTMNHHGVWDLMPDMASMVVECANKRKSQKEAEERQREKEYGSLPEVREEVAKISAAFMKRWNDSQKDTFQ
jgi:hypothetical protein